MEKRFVGTSRVALVQYPIRRFESMDHWVRNLQAHFNHAQVEGAHFICFPEYGSMDLVSLLPLELQSDLHGQIRAMQSLLPQFHEAFAHFAKQFKLIAIAPSFPYYDGEKYVNRVFVYSPDKGLVGQQDKLFMTRFELEEWNIASSGNQLSVFESEHGNFGIQICYDNEFSVGSQALVTAGADLIFAPSCTETLRGATRVHIGARARAMENQCYVAVSQTVGLAPWSPAVDINFGYAACYATPDKGFPDLGILSESKHNEPLIHVETLDFSLLAEVRSNGQVLNWKDSQRTQQVLDQQDFTLTHFRC